MKTKIIDRMVATAALQHRVGETRRLMVTREPGKKKCVLTCRAVDGQMLEVVTTMDPKMMVDYLEAQFPGETVTWHLMPPLETSGATTREAA